MSLNFSDAPPFRDLGTITAVGTAAAWIYSVLFLPAIIAVLPFKVKAVKDPDARPSTAMSRLANFVIGRQRTLLWGMSGVVLVLGAMVPQIELNDQFVNYFDKSIKFRSDTEFAIRNLSGIYQHQYSVTADGSQGINDPEYLVGLGGFTDWLRTQPEVVHVQTMSDTMKRLNKNLHGDDAGWYRLPDNRELAAQYLLLFEMSLPYGLDLNNQINVDKSATQLIATLKNVSSRESRDLQSRAQDWLKTNMPSSAKTEATGSFVMFSFISQRNIEGMLVGTTLALILISLLLFVALRSIRLGMISLVPNLVPPIMAFGIWFMLVGQVNMASSVVTATALGIIVDATVHFLSKYRRARVQRGDDAVAAVRYAFETVGTALWVTTAVLVAGFAILMLSAFDLNENMTEATGSFVMFSFISQRNIEGMLVGTTLALILISLLLFVALRSIRLGMISLVPNLVPPIMAFGIWFMLVGQVNMASSVVTATALGIIVDATVHFLSKYRRARVQRGDDAVAAVRYAFETVGTALWVTTAVLVAGFAILMLSAFDLNKSLGILTAITLVCALAADFLLLPAILMLIDKDKNPQSEIDDVEQTDAADVYLPAR